jgi:hypothetical protein
MNKPPLHNSRRTFLGNTIKLALLAGILPLEQSCGNKTQNKTSDKDSASNRTNKKLSRKKPRKSWHHEKLVMNSKSKVMHFPTSKVYTYYDEIKPKHLQEISMAAWAAQLQEPVRINREQSGNILEILSLQNLNNGVNDQSLAESAGILARAFTKEMENSKGVNPNTTSFRLHELMLQLVTLNSAIPAAGKWLEFSGKVTKPAQLRKRQKWMETETAFNERVKYILDHQNDYKFRLTERASKYNFT